MCGVCECVSVCEAAAPVPDTYFQFFLVHPCVSGSQKGQDTEESLLNVK